MVKTGLFQVDLRSLALFRIALGILVLMDLAGRVVNLRAHYTDDGVLPRSLLIHDMSEWKWSLAKLNGSFGFEVVLFALAALACLALIAGWRTQVMVVLVWVFMVSIQVRNPLVSSAADTLLRMMVFWGMLLPLGAVWSLDARREKRGSTLAMSFVSLASAGLILQIAFMYWFTAALKTGDEWRTDGTALYFATGAGQLTRPFGEFIHQFPDLLIVLTFASLGFEFLIPLLLILPLGRGWLRIAGIVGILGFHGGIALMMDVGIFPWVNTLSMMALLPALVWDSLLPNAMAWLRHRYAWLRRRLPRFDTAVPESSERKPLHSTPLLNLFAAFCLIFVFLYNVTTVTDFTLPRESRTISYGLGLYQRWNMFAPYPPRSTSWYVIRGYTSDGRAINLLPAVVTDDFSRLEPFSIYEPADIPDSYYHDKFWRKYFDAIADDGDADERRAFAQYTCRNWNDQNSGADYLDRLQFVRLRKSTLPDNKQGDTKLFKISELSCSDV